MDTANIGKGYDPRKEIPFIEQTIEEEAPNPFKGTIVSAFNTVVMYTKLEPKQVVKTTSKEQQDELIEAIDKVMVRCELLKEEICK